MNHMSAANSVSKPLEYRRTPSADRSRSSNRGMTYAPRLAQHQLRNVRLVSDRDALLSLLPSGGVVCEVGVWAGEYSRKILDIACPRQLHLIDMEYDHFQWPLFEADIAADRVIVHQADSAARLAGFPNAHFDWIYIDADHRLEGVRRDIAAARDKVKPGGLLVFNDYIRWTRRATEYGVMPAVNSLACQPGWRIAFLALSASGYNDIALMRSPAPRLASVRKTGVAR